MNAIGCASSLTRSSFHLVLSWKPILDFVDQQFLKYFQAETSFGIERKYVQDQRVHCCLYFLPPSIRG